MIISDIDIIKKICAELKIPPVLISSVSGVCDSLLRR